MEPTNLDYMFMKMVAVKMPEGLILNMSNSMKHGLFGDLQEVAIIHEISNPSYYLWNPQWVEFNMKGLRVVEPCGSTLPSVSQS